MSSRKKRNQQAAPNSNRNLDGRRLRTVEEAKKLTEYLAIKPEMEKKEKQERYDRWTRIVEESERREAEMREGRSGEKSGMNDWNDKKLDLERVVRSAVERGLVDMHESDESAEPSGASGSESAGEDDGAPSKEQEGKLEEKNDAKGKGKRVWGWDEEEEDDDMSDDEDAA